MSTDPWAAASAAPATPAGNTAVADAPQSAMASAFGPAAGGSLLFNSGVAVPSLFNKTHPLGTERTGVIEKMEDKQDQDFTSKMPKYWSTSKVGGPQRNSAVTTDAIDGPTGQQNRPVMVTHITLQTDYRITEAECVAISRDVAYVSQDAGKRVDVVGGFDFKAFGEAMEDARKRGISLNSPEDLIGKRLTKKRVGQVPSKTGGNPSWTNAYRIDNA